MADFLEHGEDAFPLENISLTGDRRTEARLCAVQVLYQALIMGQDARHLAPDFAKRLKRTKADSKVFNQIVENAAEGAERYRLMLESLLTEEWVWDRVDPVIRAILWAAVAEISARNDVPLPVVVDEFLKIANGFAAPGDVAFVHAVLDRAGKRIRD